MSVAEKLFFLVLENDHLCTQLLHAYKVRQLRYTAIGNRDIIFHSDSKIIYYLKMFLNHLLHTIYDYRYEISIYIR
jgi:hypothetical protein